MTPNLFKQRATIKHHNGLYVLNTDSLYGAFL